MKVLFTHAYHLYDDVKELKIMKPYPPLGLLYISAFLEKNGIDNEIFDSTFYSKVELYSFINVNKPTFLGVYVNLMTKINVLELIKYVKENKNLIGTKIILGGPDVKYNSENLLKAGADFIVVGEGEETTLKLIQTLEEKRYEDLKDINGIVFKNYKNEIVKTQEREKIKNIDRLPFPNRSKISFKKYFKVWEDNHGSNSIAISTMRGCPYTCKWCSRAVYGLSYRRFSPIRTIEEIQHLKEEFNPDSFWFVDDVFTISHKWLKGFSNLLNKNNIKIKYECITRSDRLNEEVILLLKESGCFRVWIGAESGSQKVIDLMDRRVDVDNVKKMIKLSKKYGIEAGTFIMLGYPGETEEDINQTIEHLKDSNPDHFTITIAYPIRGTELYEEVENLKLKDYNWSVTTDRDIDFKRTYSKKYYDFAVRRVVNEVNYFKRKNEGRIDLTLAKLKTKSIISKIGMIWERKKQHLI